MYKTAESLMTPFKDDPAVKYKLVCLWVSISANYIIVLFPALARTIGGIIAGILDVELETRKELNNGILSKKEGHPSSSSNTPPS
jgi:hypothetical protein